MEILKRNIIGVVQVAHMDIDQDTTAMVIEEDMVHTDQWLLDIHALLLHVIVAKDDAVAAVSVVKTVLDDIAQEMALHPICSVQIVHAEGVSGAAEVVFARSVV